MDLIPAIDLLDGVAVRLVQGDYARRAASVDDPAPLVTDWVRAGAPWLHLVDLGGARAGQPVHLDLAAGLVRRARKANSAVRVELGGGLRTMADIEASLAAGIDVALLGTAAAENPSFLAEAAGRWPGRIAMAIDVRGERLALDGWERTAEADPVRLAAELVGAGAAHLVVTDVRRDGTRSGPNLELLARMRGAVPNARLVAAGGIATAQDLRSLAAAGVDGAVVGLALIDGSLPIDEALEAAGQPVAERA